MNRIDKKTLADFPESITDELTQLPPLSSASRLDLRQLPLLLRAPLELPHLLRFQAVDHGAAQEPAPGA